MTIYSLNFQSLKQNAVSWQHYYLLSYCIEGTHILATTLCCEGQTLTDIVEYHHNLFVELYGQCNKVRKNSFVQIQIDWKKYCSAFLLEDDLSLQTIGVVEDHSVSDIRQVWLEFCAANNTSVPINNRVMIIISSGVYTTLLEHASKLSISSIETKSPLEVL